MKKRLKAGIVGCGRIASLFAADKKRKGIVTHAQAYLDRSDMELVAACDLDGERLNLFSKTWDIKKTYTNSYDMLTHEKLDIVSICTPPQAHFKIARAAILKGVCSVFCEKPLAFSLEEADELVELAHKHRTIFAVNHSRRWDKCEQKVGVYIRSGKIGKIQGVDCYYTAGIANTGSHLIDLLRMITGDEVRSVQAFDNGLPNSSDPSPDICLRMSSGYNCFFHGLRVDNYLVFEIDVYGSSGRLRITDSGFNVELWKSALHKHYSGYHQLVPAEHSFGLGLQDVLKNAIKNIVSAINGEEKLCSSVEDGRIVLEVIIAVRQSLKKNGMIIELPIRNRKLTLAK